MAGQIHSAALNPLKTVKLSGASLASATLRATLRAALVAAPYSMSGLDADAILDRAKHLDLFIESSTTAIWMSDAGQVADNTMMPYRTGDRRQIRNCKFAAAHTATATLFTDDAYDIRVELYS